MLADFPAAYEGEPGFEFLKEVPTTWDHTKVPDAKVGAFITVARSKNDDWYVGSITNSRARTITFPLSFLSAAYEYEATIYTDIDNGDPNQLQIQTSTVKHTDVVSIKLSPGGGMVMHFRRKN